MINFRETEDFAFSNDENFSQGFIYDSFTNEL